MDALLPAPEPSRGGVQARRCPRGWASLAIPQTVLPGTRRGPCVALTLPSLHALLLLLLWCLHHVFCLAARPPLVPSLLSPCHGPPSARPWLLACPGSASGRNRQPSQGPEPRPRSSGAGGAEVRARRLRQVSVGGLHCRGGAGTFWLEAEVLAWDPGMAWPWGAVGRSSAPGTPWPCPPLSEMPHQAGCPAVPGWWEQCGYQG